jgi:hypothetical protein
LHQIEDLYRAKFLEVLKRDQDGRNTYSDENWKFLSSSNGYKPKSYINKDNKELKDRDVRNRTQQGMG